MTDQYPAGTAVTLEFDTGGVDPVSASYSVIDDSGAFLETDTPVGTLATPLQITIDATLNEPGDTSTSARTVVLTYENGDGNKIKSRKSYILTTGMELVAGERSVIGFTQFLALYHEMPQGPLARASDHYQTRALLSAYRNIDKLDLKFSGLIYGERRITPLSHRRVSDFTKEELLELKNEAPRAYDQLARAQIIEADGILGAYPVEDRRRADIISDSSGESAKFFRTSLPPKLPVYRATAEQLKGLVDWSGDPFTGGFAGTHLEGGFF